jgi:hypothetical protein
MKFIEMTGKHLVEIVNRDEFFADDWEQAGVRDDTVVRINLQGDIEVRRPHGWDVIGGLIGDFEERIKQRTDMDWA